MSPVYLLKKIDGALVKQAESALPADYRRLLRSKQSYEQSLVGRYLVSLLARQFGEADFLPQTGKNGRPQALDGPYWSVSHKQNVVAAAVSDRPVGIDVEIPVRRETAVFTLFSDAEWDAAGGQTWDNFYLLWTAKEALIKKIDGELDDLTKIRFLRRSAGELRLLWNGKEYSIACFRKNGFFLSLA